MEFNNNLEAPVGIYRFHMSVYAQCDIQFPTDHITDGLHPLCNVDPAQFEQQDACSFRHGFHDSCDFISFTALPTVTESPRPPQQPGKGRAKASTETWLSAHSQGWSPQPQCVEITPQVQGPGTRSGLHPVITWLNRKARWEIFVTKLDRRYKATNQLHLPHLHAWQQVH